MYRFYSKGPITGNTFNINDKDQMHHIRGVLRLEVGERIVIFDGTGTEYTAEISRINKSQVQTRLIETKSIQMPGYRLAIACALPKLGRMDEIVDALTQIGVDVIIPMTTERTVVRLEEANKEARLSRWRKIAISAAKQSKRATVPDVLGITTFSESIQKSSQYSVRLIAALCVTTRPLCDVLSLTNGNSMLVLIGPEGDFTSQEVDTAIKVGFEPVSLGRNVLRVATAAIAIAAYIKLSNFRAE